MTNERYQRGLDRLKELDGQDGVDWARAFADKHPDFARLTVEYPYGDVWTRPQLSDRDREIAVLAALTTLGGVEKELASHVTMARKVGLSREEINEILILMSVYAGFPKALSALEIATVAQASEAAETSA